jgi:tRNA 2-selenouridine synthase
MPLTPIAADQALQRLDSFSAVIDARSPSEWALDHLPGALNWPTLDDAQRAEVGTLYKQIGAFDARKRGAALAAANIAQHIDAHVRPLPKSWQPLVYCWRGGQRSGSLALVLSQIGFAVHLIEGGYKAFRAAMLTDMAAQVARLEWRVVCGPTGSGKTRLLQALADAGQPALDLEALAGHRSSVLGLPPGTRQPSQKHFEMRVWNALRQLPSGMAIWVEAESKKVGNVSVPDTLMQAMRASPCVDLQLPRAERVALLLEDYGHFVHDSEHFKARLDTLRPLRGGTCIDRWHELIDAGQHANVVDELLTVHYDPGYAASTARNFAQFGHALAIAPVNRSPTALLAALAAPASD